MSKHNKTSKPDDIRNVKISIEDNAEGRKIFETIYDEIKAAQHSQQNAISIISALLDKPLDFYDLIRQPEIEYPSSPWTKHITTIDSIVHAPDGKRTLVELVIVRQPVPLDILIANSMIASTLCAKEIDNQVTIMLLCYEQFMDKRIKNVFSFKDSTTGNSMIENVSWITFEIPKIESLTDEDNKSLNDRAKSWLKLLNADTEEKLRAAVTSSDTEQVYEDVMRNNRDPEFRKKVLQDLIRDSKT
ncbi:MAG: hypothetical protein LBC43_02915 [Bifidobacteriaceae bacterium]|jgi:hypothetical protein|nr:hypothetical protein [Bifidobacteriaceae bacterium]